MSSKDIFKPTTPAGGVKDHFLNVTEGIYKSLEAVINSNLSSPQMHISNREISDLLIPRDALSSLASISSSSSSSSLQSSSKSLLLTLLREETSPYYGTVYSIRNIARTLTLLPAPSDGGVGESVKDILKGSPKVYGFYVRFFKVGEVDILGKEGRKKRKQEGSGDADEGLDIMINDGTGIQRTKDKGRDKDADTDVQTLISAMTFLTSVLKLPIQPNIIQEDAKDAKTLLPFFLPTFLTKKFSTKLLLHSDTLLVHTTLELLSVVFARCIRSDILSPPSKDFVELMKSKLPELQTILTLKTKFDSFSKSTSDPEKDNITYSLLELISLYYSFLITTTHSSNSVKYDFTKLLPPSSDVFFSKPEPLQGVLLKTLYAVFSKKDKVAWTKSSLSVVFTILLDSAGETSSHAQKVAMKVISPFAPPLSFENYVASCLLSLVKASHVPTLSEVMEDVMKNAIRHSMACAMAGVNNEDIPAFLAALIERATKEKTAPDFRDLVFGVLDRAIKFSPDPLSLCKLIKHLADGEGAVLKGDVIDAALLIVGGEEVPTVTFSEDAFPPFTVLRDVREILFAHGHSKSTHTYTKTLKNVKKRLGNESRDDPHYADAVRAFFREWERTGEDESQSLFSDVIIEVLRNLKFEEISGQEELVGIVEELYLKKLMKSVSAKKQPTAKYLTMASPIIYHMPASSSSLKSSLFVSLVSRCEKGVKKGDWRMKLLEGFKDSADVEVSGDTLLGLMGVMEGENTKSLVARLIKAAKEPLRVEDGGFDIGEFLERYAEDEVLMDAILGNNPKALAPYINGKLGEVFFSRLGLEEGMDVFGLEDYDIKILREVPGMLEGEQKEELTKGLERSLLDGVERRGKVKMEEKAMASEMGLLAGARSLNDERLNTVLLVRVCSALPRACRKKGNGDHDFRKLLEIVEGLEDFDSDLMDVHKTVLNDASLTMLKHGALVGGEGLLELLRRIMVWNKNDGLVGYDSVKVFLLLISHSSFEEGVKGETGILETVLLCLKTAKEEREDLGAEDLESMVDSIMREFGAGVGVRDLLVRKILFVLEVEFDFVRGTEMMGWKGVERERGLGWGGLGWFVGAVEERRVKATLGNFPVGDAVVPSEVAMTVGDGTEEGRYSVGFLLPVALTFVESILPEEEPEGFWEYMKREREGGGEGGERVGGWEGGGESFGEEEKAAFALHASQKERFISATRRLCENGVVALALASLCCKDALARKMAVGFLGILYEYGFEDAESSKVTGWSARPQLSLVVGSLLAGLKDGGGDNGYVPKLPCAAALFLAQSFLIMGRPSSPMYGGVNSYYLKQDGGKFTDLNAVPGFGQMFFGKDREERMWMMRLLVEGTKGNHDYQVMGRRYAHSLVMATCDSEGADMEEKRMCLSVLEAAIVGGGKGAVKGLLEGGMVGWMGVVGRRGWGEWGAGVKLKWLEVAGQLVKRAREEGVEGGGMLDVEIETMISMLREWGEGGGGGGGGGGEEEERVKKGMEVCRRSLLEGSEGMFVE